MMLIDVECTCNPKETKEENTGEKCKHTEKALNIIKSRKTIYEFGILKDCKTCEKENTTSSSIIDDGVDSSSTSIWMCLQCGNQACGRNDRNHANQHFETPQTDSHCLVLDVCEWKPWCYECNNYINIDSCRRTYQLVTDLKRMATTKIVKKIASKQDIIDVECTCSGSKKNEDANADEKCKHTEKAINLNDTRRKINEFGILRECKMCEKENETTPPLIFEDGVEPCPPAMWMCLQCGNQACGRNDRNHANQHFTIPRTGSHCLVLDTYQWKLWCYQCNNFINSDSCVRTSQVVSIIKRMANTSKVKKISPKAAKKAAVELKKVKPKFVFGLTKVIGLSNLGNTCFFNAVLQCLAQTPFLVKVLEDMQKPGQTFVLPGGKYVPPGSTEEILLPPIEGTSNKECSLTQVLQKTLTDMQNSNGETYKPSELLNILRKKNSLCMDGGQHDSHELLRHLLEHVRGEDLRRYQHIILKYLNLCGQTTKNNDDDKISRLKFYGHQASARLLGAEPVFKGILVSTLECLECHHTSPRTEPFLDLSLPVMADKPQPPSQRRKSSGIEDPLVLMNSYNSSSNANKTAKRRAKRVGGKSKNTKQKNLKNNQSTISEENNTHDNDELADSENSKTEKSRDYSASGSESDIEDNVEPESGTEQNSKSQEILESGYSSEKLSTLTSPASPDNSQDTRDVDSTVNSLNECETFANNCCQSLKNGDTKETMNSIINDNENDNDNEVKNKSQEFKLNLENSTGDMPSIDDEVVANNSSETPSSSSSPVNEKEVNDEKIIVNDNGEKTKENGKKNEEESNYTAEAKDDENNDSKVKNEGNNDDYSNTNGTEKIRTSATRIEMNHKSIQSPSRYTTCEGEFSIQSCLNQFTAQELMTNNNAVGCKACTDRENKGKENGKMVRTPSTKQYLMSNVPAVLILHLKRFQSQRMSFCKVTKHVKFPTILNLAPVCKNHDEPKIYSLYGVVEHSGTLYGGHYVAYVKTRQPLSPNDPRWSFLPKQESTETEKLENDVNSQPKSEENSNSSDIEPLPGQWYSISDSRVVDVDESTVLKSEAYLLFYERIL